MSIFLSISFENKTKNFIYEARSKKILKFDHWENTQKSPDIPVLQSFTDLD